MTSNDPLGYLVDLERAGADLRAAADEDVGEAALRVVVAWGRCRRTGTPVPQLLDGRFTVDHLGAARDELVTLLAGWSRSVATLGDDWYACQSPVDADDLCEHWLDRRTEVWAAEVAFAEAGMPVDVGPFDTALRLHEGVLATVVGFNWYENHRSPFLLAGTASAAWWLSDHLPAVAAATERRAEATLPPPGYFSVVREARDWRAGEPGVVAPLAASSPQDSPDTRVFRWRSPDGAYTATLAVLATMTESDRRTVPYPLYIERGEYEPATELGGQPLRLGAVRRNLNAEGEASATVAEWWANSDGRLFVGDPPVAWPRVFPPQA